ncbi:radical SAM/SPASM domain-containing protein [Vallitalea okinawensis]|uniref:radical SAM/SPASM domain-containing protein n=1 Tax=Vallitalea okinawensis TaxID=2078660 RepID=UPI000CFB875B|nr:radical SAM protein [Vallitalea okinawensis]
MRSVKPNSASLLLTEDCNLRCKYCFEKHKKNYMSKEVATKAIEYLAKNAAENGMREFHTMLFGGEPLMDASLLEHVFKTGLLTSEKYGVKYTASIVTNGTIYNDELDRIFKTYKDKVSLGIQISVDGTKEIHDANRVTVNGKGSFDMIEKNIEEFKAMFGKEYINRLNLHGVMSKETISGLYKSWKFFRDEWNVPRLWFLFLQEDYWTQEHINTYSEQLGMIKDDILARVKRDGNIKEVENYAPLDRCLRPDRRALSPCGAGKNFVTITAKGDIYPCHHFYFNDPDKETLIGNIDEDIDDSKRRLFLAYDSDDMSCDKDCKHNHCYRCIAVNWVENGSILSQVRGSQCSMAHVEMKFQHDLKEELENMGLKTPETNVDYRKGNNPNNPDCLCDSRGTTIATTGQSGFNNPKSKCTCDSKDENIEIIAGATKLILEQQEEILTNQRIILKMLANS